MDLVKLHNEITNDPLGRGYATMTDAQVFDSLTTADRVVLSLDRYKALDIMAALGPSVGASILDTIESAATYDSRIKWFMRELSVDGIALGHPQTRATIDDLVAGSILLPTEGDALKAIPERTISRAEELGLSGLQPGDIITARIY